MELKNFLPYQLSVLSNKISAGIAKFYRDQYGISIAEWRVLALLANNEDAQTAKQLTIKSQMDKVKISRTMKSLLDKKLVSEKTSDQDKRARHYLLKKTGTQLINAIKPKALLFEKKLIQSLSEDEISSLKIYIERLNQQVDKISEEN